MATLLNRVASHFKHLQKRILIVLLGVFTSILSNQLPSNLEVDLCKLYYRLRFTINKYQT